MYYHEAPQIEMDFNRPGRWMHPHSSEAFVDEKFRFGQRANLIFNFFKDHTGTSFTDRELCAALSFVEMNMVRPRVTELIHLGLVHQTGSKICNVTGKRVRLVAAVVVL